MSDYEVYGGIQPSEGRSLEDFSPLTIIIRGIYLDNEGNRHHLTRADLRDHIQKQMDRFEPTDKNKAGRVASALEKLWQRTPQEPTETGIVRHQEGISKTPHIPVPLNPRERRIMDARHNPENEKLTLEKLGKEFGVTRDRIRQIESKALAKVRYANEHPGKRAVYHGLTFLSDPSRELALRMGPQTATNVSTFLIAELNPGVVINPNAQVLQQEFEGPTPSNA